MKDLRLTFSPQRRIYPDCCPKKRRRSMNPSVEERASRSSIRGASTLFFVLATSNAIWRSDGFIAPSIVQRPESFLYFSRRNRRKKSSPNSHDGPNHKDDRKEIQDLFAIIDGSSGRMPDNKPTSPRTKVRPSPNNSRSKKRRTFSSSVSSPPMETKSEDRTTNPDKMRERDGSVSQGLSSWEDFLGGTPSSSGRIQSNLGDKNDAATAMPQNDKSTDKVEERSARTLSTKNNQISIANNNGNKDLLPSIADLFPSNFTTSDTGGEGQDTQNSKTFDNLKGNTYPPSSSILDGVLPISDLFYRPLDSEGNGSQNDGHNNEDNSEQRDDEELPFSAEQSDQLTSSRNKIKIRRNKVKAKEFEPSMSRRNKATAKSNKSTGKKKLQRRGMEMLVGGVPINADPPQRSIELMYQHDTNVDWKDVIATNARDFGPIFYRPSLGKISEIEKGLYCEFFVNSTSKWDVCPKDLRSILKMEKHTSDLEIGTEAIDQARLDDINSNEIQGGLSSNSSESTMKEALRSRMVGSMKEAFRKASAMENDKNKPFSMNSNAELSGELVFSIGISKEELVSSGGTESAKSVLERVLATGISTSSQCTGFNVTFSKLQLSDLGDGTTTISAGFILTIENNASMSFAEVKKKCNVINTSLAQAMDDGDMQLAMAAAAENETAWSEDFRSRIVEEFLFDDDDYDEPLDDNGSVNGKNEPNLESTIDSLLSDLNYEVRGFKEDQPEVPFGMPGSPVYSKDDIFLGGGNDGVFWNYAADNASQAPYQGKLGLRLVDAVVEKAKQRHPRVIAIGDVHGCIDELQDLLRECDYRPGDLVVFLGDLVSKGPDSIAVVQMAREIGAIGVRGNHDFEVVRWHQAIKSGVDSPVVGSEHFHIANCLTTADMKWLYSLPWYISSPDLGALFVHAGFVSGIRLGKQNPRLMMNMRSILPDGTVTSKFFNNWPWARLWDGPQTVLFGHDADRGLQQYEHAIGLDTGCVYGGRLTACILPEKKLVSVNARREYFKYRRKHYD